MLNIFNVFFKTALYGFRLIGKNEASRIFLKQQWAKMVLKTFGFSLNVYGQAPEPGAQIIVGNHISYLDIAVIMSALPEVTFIAKDDLKKWPIIGAGAAVVGTIFVNRRDHQNRKATRNEVVKILQENNKCVAIFPSGTTTLYEQAPWKKGAFEIAKQAKVPVHLFRIDYSPLRSSAYIDNDNLLQSMKQLSKIKRKSADLRWLGQFDQIDEPSLFAEELRQKVIFASQNAEQLHEI